MSGSAEGFVRRWLLMVCGALFALGCVSYAAADVLYDTSVAEEFSAADLVVEAVVVGMSGKCNPGRCSTVSYEIRVERKFPRGGAMGPGSKLTVCAQSRLGLGQRLVFMLRQVRNVGVDDPSTDIDESAGRCAYANDFGAVFLNFAGDYYRIGSPEASTLVRERDALYLTIGKFHEGLLAELEQLSAAGKQ